MDKKAKTVLKCVIAILVVFVLFKGYDMYSHSNEKNVFDEIYYSELQLANADTKPFPNPSMANVTQIRVQNWKTPYIWYDNETHSEHYNIEALPEGRQISIHFNKKEKNMSITYYIDYSETFSLSITSFYDVDKSHLHQNVCAYDSSLSDDRHKCAEEIYPYLEQYGISIDEVIALSNEGLHEIFLPDWFEGNKGHSKFSMDNLGNFTITKDPILEQGD